MRVATASEELFADVGRGVTLCYQTYGDPADDPLLLIMGLGGPMTWWDSEFCELLADRGFYVVRFDNRDIGRSTRMQGTVSVRKLVAAFLGVRVPAPYSLRDMAEDTFGLMDHLGLSSAHVCGVSMGGMIAQTMAIARPERVRSLVSIMSTTGNRRVGWQHPSLFPTLLSGSRDEEEYVASGLRVWDLIGSPGFPADKETLAQRARDTYARGVTGPGVGRQMMAVITQPDRTRALAKLPMPVTVVHGLGDRMVHVSGGRATAAAVPGAEIVLIRGMGHDMPPALWETLVATIRRTADRAAASSA